MVIYISKDFKCHIINDGTMTQVQTNFFDGKCEEFIKGYRFIPFGESWMREDGTVFHGEMISPWKPYEELDQAQRVYEQEHLAKVEEALEILLGVE